MPNEIIIFAKLISYDYEEDKRELDDRKSALAAKH